MAINAVSPGRHCSLSCECSVRRVRLLLYKWVRALASAAPSQRWDQMAPTKRAAGDEAAPPPGRRLRATVALGPSPSRSNPAPLPSPRKRFRAVALVVLCFKRPYYSSSLSFTHRHKTRTETPCLVICPCSCRKDRSTDDCVPISPLQIGRLVSINREKFSFQLNNYL